MALRDQPYFPFYVDDFLTDEKLNECSAKSTGVYIKILCIMHKMEQYGSIELKQKYKQNGSKNVIEGFSKMLTKQISFSQEEILDGLVELIAEDVLQLQGNLLIQKRMYRDGEVSRKRAEAGSKGGAKTTEDDKQSESKTLSKTKAKDKQNPVYVYVNEYETNNRDRGVGEGKDVLDIVFYLNQIAGTNYKPTSKKTQTLIKARLKEGYTLTDFKTVIEKKCSKWQRDPKMAQYLRPETLFGSKFESYLNEPAAAEKTFIGILEGGNG